MIHRWCVFWALIIAGNVSATGADKWQEAVVVTAHADVWQSFFTDVAGWQQRQCDPVGRAELAYLGAAKGSYRACLFANSDDERGWVRVVEVDATVGAGRTGAMPWDTGGFFSLMVYATSVDATYQKAVELGFDALAPPVRLSAGTSTLSNVVLRGPDTVNIAAYQRHSPPLTEFPHMRRLSTAFNVMMMVNDLEAMGDFLRRTLEYREVVRGDFLDPAPGPNNFGLPHNWANKAVRRFSIFGPDDSLDGRVELLRFVGLDGRAVDAGRSFHRGILALRFPVDDLSDALSRIGSEPEFPSTTLDLAPYGPVRIAGFLAPEGGRFDLFEVIR